MMQFNIHEAKAQLSKLITAVEQGEDVVIARYGKPVAKLVSIQQSAKPRSPGSAKGKFAVPESFFEPLPKKVIDSFYK